VHSTNSILMTTLERIRTFLDDPSLDAKYTNHFLISHVIEPEMVNVITGINQQREDPILCKFSLDNLEVNNTSIELPPNVGTIYRITSLNAAGDVLDDIAKRDDTDPRGPGWHLDGRDLYLRPDWTPDTAGYEVWYAPSGDFSPHYSADGGELESGALTFILDSTPDVGDYDRREGAYIGGVLRVWNADKTIIQEQVISGYDVSTKTVTVRRAFGTADIPVASSLRYEIVPEYMGHIWQAVALAGSMNLGAARNINEKQMGFLKEQFSLALQSAMVLTANKIDNKSIAPENSVLYDIIQRIRWGLPGTMETGISNDYIMRSAVGPKLAEVSTLINGISDSQTVVRQNITFVSDQEFYNLPPCVGKILRISKLSTTIKKGLVVDEIRQRDENDPNGEGWSVQGLRLSMRPIPYDYAGEGVNLANYTIWYTPSGDFMPHYASNGSLADGEKVLTLSGGNLFSRQLGTIDKRDNAYLGATLRVFQEDGSIEERTITAHDAGAGTVTVTEAFTGFASAGPNVCAYEIVSPWMYSIMSAVVARSILELVALKGQISESDMAIVAESAKSSLTAAITNAKEKNSQEIVPNKDSSLHMILEKTKTILSDVAKELDYSDDYIFRHGITPEYSRVMSRIQNTSSDYIIAKTTVSFVKDQQYYELPSCIGEILRIVTMYDDGRIKTELLPRNQYHTKGPNWSIEGNRLSIRPFPQIAEDVEIWYIPTVDVKPHYAEDGKVNLTRAAISLSLSEGGWGSSMLGDIDRRKGIYQGCLIRVITNKGEIEERIIDEYVMNAAEGTGYPSSVVLSSTLTETSLSDSIVKYEILPSYFHAVAEAVAQGAAMNLLVGARKVTKAQYAMLLSNFKSAMKTAMDHHTFKQNRIPKSYDKDTVDNRNKYGGLYGIR